MKPTKPRVLLYDVENTAHKARTWGKWEQNVIKFDKYSELLSVAYRWLGERTIYCITREGQKTDCVLLLKTRELFNRADVIIAHNGDASDQRKVRARMIFHGITPFKVLTTVDTLKVARRHFQFPGNSLADLAEFLGVGKKLSTGGYDLWTGCEENVRSAWRRMERYNKHDVRLLTAVYRKLRPWIIGHPSLAALAGRKGGCPACSSWNVKKDGIRATAAGVRQRMACKSCGHPYAVAMARVPKAGGDR